MDTSLTTSSPRPVFSSPLLSPHRWLAALRRLWAARRRRAIDRAQLLALDERELRDLGLGRDEIERWLEQPAGRPRR
ncbi:DUF1127 domain-containing protein [Roseateles sp. DAIF2]|uniref:DUF1127 domain-containing protein n=1 Tax=Roseateles sp. DAIF2 TaxID=2714952 RepID=UPI0018A2FEA4|nr:DUF1127 domain-containing protein [Roseateles sp. DAIF2]QPF75766.1 DUF1127 domain-containing protein [Roseateles sp. DAIF2]